MWVKAKNGLLHYKPHLEMIMKDSNEVKSSQWQSFWQCSLPPLYVKRTVVQHKNIYRPMGNREYPGCYLGACKWAQKYEIFVLHVNCQQGAYTIVSSVTQSCPTLCDPMNHSTPGLPVHHQLPEFTQTYLHRVGDAIQLSHPLSSPLFFLPPIPPSIRVFSNKSTLCMTWPKSWSFQL